MNLQNITLSKRSQSQTTTYLYDSTHIYGNIPKCKSTEIENRLVAGRRQGDRQVTAEWYRASFRDGEKSFGSLWWWLYISQYTKNHRIVHFNCVNCMICESQFCCSVAKSCPTLCHPMDYGTPGFPVLHYLLQLAQIHVHWANDAT